MALKSIFVPFFEEKSAETAFRAALALVKAEKGHICVMHLRARPLPATNVYFPLGGVSTAFTESFLKAENDLAQRLSALFEKLCKEAGVSVMALGEHTSEHGVTASWVETEGDPMADYASSAMACDISVVAAAGDDATALEEAVTESLLFQSGRPVLLCPQTGFEAVAKKVAVAWNGSEESTRAVAASLDLLKAAETVFVISVCKAGDPLVNTDAIADYMRLHGVKVTEAKIEVTGDENPTARLDDEIRDENPDLLVMGAYSHSRWREAVLGGFTRHIIRKAKMPVFMVH